MPIGNGTVLLAGHPEQRQQLIEDPTRIPDAIEEMLRIESPTQALPRRPVRDVELHGVTLPEGSRVTVLFGSANHDERVFDQQNMTTRQGKPQATRQRAVVVGTFAHQVQQHFKNSAIGRVGP